MGRGEASLPILCRGDSDDGTPQQMAGDEAHVWLIPARPAAPDPKGGAQQIEPARALWAPPLGALAAHGLGVLSEAEVARASRFHFERDRVQFVRSHVAMRHILSWYVSVEPRALRFEANAFGKPHLAVAGQDGYTDVQFNLSHAGGMALLAVARGVALGVDVEPIRADFAWQPIAKRFFSRRERDDIAGLPEHEQYRAFFRCWTRKEAYIKARGQGLSLPLASFDVSVRPDEPAALLEVRHPDGTGRGEASPLNLCRAGLDGDASPLRGAVDVRRWSMFDVDAGDGFAAALAADGVIRQVKCRGWDETCGL